MQRQHINDDPLSNGSKRPVVKCDKGKRTLPSRARRGKPSPKFSLTHDNINSLQGRYERWICHDGGALRGVRLLQLRRVAVVANGAT